MFLTDIKYQTKKKINVIHLESDILRFLFETPNTNDTQ